MNKGPSASTTSSYSKRSRVDIFADILEVLKRRSNSRITRISYAVGLPVDRAKKSLFDLSSYGLVKIQEGEETYYQITHRGLEFLDAYRKLESFLLFLGEKSPIEGRARPFGEDEHDKASTGGLSRDSGSKGTLE